MDRPSRKMIILSENVGRFLLRGESYLSRSGFLLVAGETGRDILDLAARERPAAVVLGFDLKDIPGDEVCRRLKRTLDPPPAVLVVGPARPPEPALRCSLAGCDEYLASPVEPEALLARLSSRLGVRFRVHPRLPLVVPVSHGRIIREFLGYTRDVSEGGAQIESILKPGPGRRLVLRLYPDAHEALELRAVVLRAEPSREKDQNLLGLQFLPPAPQARSRLKDLLKGRGI
jgi:CheY-like chemotaxis protein